MAAEQRYQQAREQYRAAGVDTDKALQILGQIPISLHCWQGDDVRGFERDAGLCGGGIQATGDYPGRARTPSELMDDIDAALRLIPGRHKLNIHASYAMMDPGETADRDTLEPRHFAKWVGFAKERGMGLDFNPTFFSHPRACPFTLSSPDEETRRFFIRHGQACLRIAESFASALSQPCVLNFWIPDGLKDLPADRLSPRARFCGALDEILQVGYDKEKVIVTLESKVFGIGLESYTVGSSEFSLCYAASRGVAPLLDNGHYHPTEQVADKISALLLFFDTIALHVTRPVRWDSDHVALFDDETRELAAEIVRCGALGRVKLALDYFDASINRVAAWVIGMRSLQKALLYALLTPHEAFAALEGQGDYTRLMMRREELKTLPFGAVWDAFCERCGVPAGEGWYAQIEAYERDVLRAREAAL